MDKYIIAAVDEIVERLIKIKKEQEVSEDVLEDLPEKVQRLFEEQKRRIAELETESKQIMSKLKKAERCLEDEQKAKDKLERKYNRLRTKFAKMKGAELPGSGKKSRNSTRGSPQQIETEEKQEEKNRLRLEYLSKLRKRGNKPNYNETSRKPKRGEDSMSESKTRTRGKPETPSRLHEHLERLTIATREKTKDKTEKPRTPRRSPAKKTPVKALKEDAFADSLPVKTRPAKTPQQPQVEEDLPIAKRLPKRAAAGRR